ncbi:NAD(P)/FAD-dependent oxidoreductase [Proteinivorax hydrogeniformans]|uniref:NAD(P)/FAD-dependent oxidoreductase n=1 Tax=Proteinivorax hydrogeniformans TaxID=1826727 RepID=A0AAU8HT37_9FIRM
MDNKQIVVIGGGAAGLLAAATAASRGHAVTLLEKNDRLGTKLLITGKGRCNITNSADVETLISNVVHNKEFLYSAFYTFDNNAVIQLIEKQNVPTKVERGGRVFPVSDKSADVVNALKRHAKRQGVEIKYNSVVKSIKAEDNKVSKVVLKDETSIPCDSVVVATGGKSYPGTGSTGDGYHFAKRLGHNIIPPKPALTPLEVKEDWVKDLQGLSLKNTELKLFKDGKLIFEDFGEMLFTHYGISGPMALSASGHIQDIKKGDFSIKIDLKPALDEKKLDERIQKDFQKYSRKIFANSLGELLPKKLIPVMIKLSEIPEDKPVNQISKEERQRLVHLLKGLVITPLSLRGFKEAIITAGGVDVKEVDPSTMESKIVQGLYFAGEVLDLDAYTGGFNLQIAFSTGYLAGINVK